MRTEEFSPSFHSQADGFASIRIELDHYLHTITSATTSFQEVTASATQSCTYKVNISDEDLAQTLAVTQQKAKKTRTEIDEKQSALLKKAFAERAQQEGQAKAIHNGHLKRAKKEYEETVWLEDAQLESSLHKAQSEYLLNEKTITSLSKLLEESQTRLAHELGQTVTSKLINEPHDQPASHEHPSAQSLNELINKIDLAIAIVADNAILKLFRSRKKSIELGSVAYDLILQAKADTESLAAIYSIQHESRAAEIQAKNKREIGYATQAYQVIAQNSERKAGSAVRHAYESYEKISDELSTRRTKDLKALEELETQLNSSAHEKHETEIESANSLCTKLTQDAQAKIDTLRKQAQRQLIDAVSNGKQRIKATQDLETISNPAWKATAKMSQPKSVPMVITVANASLDLESRIEQLEPDLQNTLALPSQLQTPVVCSLPGPHSLLIRHDAQSRSNALSTMRSVMLRILASFPAGKVRFMMADPVEIGQSFAGFMPLSDQEPSPVGNRIWSDPQKIERQLADITEHMQTVIQKYLRADYETIEDYNKAAGEISEPYRFVIIADLPSALTENGAARLKSILETGPRCGVYAILSADIAESLPPTITAETLNSTTLTMQFEQGVPQIIDDRFEEVIITPIVEPEDSIVSDVLERVAQAGTQAGRVEVPFDRLAPEKSLQWTRSCDHELVIPIGRSGAQKNQELRLGMGTRQHALIAGRTGSGKSTLLHVIITAAALWHSPDELELYLIDFKKGVEFKAYTKGTVPHIRAVAIESDREFGLSVLKRLDDELTTRGELFRKLGSQDLAAARSSAPQESLPRVLLLIDEFQEFFTEDDEVSSEATLLLDRLVRQGRAFGVHVVLGSQTLAGAYSLARSTLGQIGVRIALQCSEADSYLILGEDNNAARLLERPGEAIYNNAGGLVEGNSPFQTAWLPDAQRDSCLAQLPKQSKEYPPTVVFEGNLPAQFDKSAAAMSQAFPIGKSPRILLGDAVAIAPPTSVLLQKRSGANLLIIGPQPEPALGMLMASTITAGATPKARVFVIDPTPDDDAMYGRIASAITASGINAQIVTHHKADETVSQINQTVIDRGEHAGDPIILVLAGIHRLRSLRKSDDYSFSMDESSEAQSPDKALANILREGPAVGVWTLAWCDTLTNAERAMERSTVREFGLRALMQMSASDSAALVDSSIASTLGANRAILADDVAGTLQKFIPIDLPNASTAKAAAQYLATIRQNDD